MSIDSQEFVDIISKFRELPKRDQRAIQRKLTSDERELLKRHMSGSKPVTETYEPETSAELDPKSLNLKHLSPWFAKHLKKNVFAIDGTKESLVTHSTLAVLPEILISSGDIRQ